MYNIAACGVYRMKMKSDWSFPITVFASALLRIETLGHIESVLSLVARPEVPSPM